MKANELRKYCLEYLDMLKEEQKSIEPGSPSYINFEGKIWAFETLIDKIKRETEKDEDEKDEISMDQYDKATVELFELYLTNSNRSPEWYDNTARILNRIIENKRESMWLIDQVVGVKNEQE